MSTPHKFSSVYLIDLLLLHSPEVNIAAIHRLLADSGPIANVSAENEARLVVTLGSSLLILASLLACFLSAESFPEYQGAYRVYFLLLTLGLGRAPVSYDWRTAGHQCLCDKMRHWNAFNGAELSVPTQIGDWNRSETTEFATPAFKVVAIQYFTVKYVLNLDVNPWCGAVQFEKRHNTPVPKICTVHKPPILLSF